MVDSSKRFRRGRKRRNIDWAKYTNFRSRHSKDDLAKLCAGYKQNELQQIFNTPDKTGLYPIHWASIHNRSDLIEFLAENGSRLRLRCKNKLFADGTSLHLAAMNGCIEAASMLLRASERAKQETTKPKSLYKDEVPPPLTEDGPKLEARDQSGVKQSDNWLAERDAEGQTPLMRSAAPKSKRLDIVGDLLRKNLWSLSARPAEMALFLINKGADWRELDSKFYMNLMHLAIVNDYDDIVNMLIVIDRQLLDLPAKVKQTSANTPSTKTQPQPPSENKPSKPKSPEDFVTVKLDSSSSPSSDSSNQSSNSSIEQSGSSKPLIDRKEVASNLLSSGLTPLQLAIIYGRLNIISLIWTNLAASRQNPESFSQTEKDAFSKNHSIETKGTAVDSAELRATLLRVVWSNKDELFSLVRRSFLKILLAIDLTLITLVWMPTYLTTKGSMALNLKGCIFLASYCVTLLLVLRVIFKNPGYLPKNRERYFHELAKLVGRTNNVARGSDKKNSKAMDGVEQHEQRDLLQLEDARQSEEVKTTTGYSNANAQNNNPPQTKPSTSNSQDGQRIKGADLEERVRLLCHKCRTIRKRRSRHCDYCNNCVQDFDHHCIYLGCCIGRNNRLDFLIMLVVASLTAIYGTIIQANSLDREQWQSVWHFLGLVSVSKYASICSLTVFFILRRASLGVTMYEEIRSNRIRRIFGPNGAPMNIMRSHKMYSTLKGSFWRHAPNRYLTGDLPFRKILANLKEFTNHTSITDYFKFSNLCADFSLARSMFKRDTKVHDMYKNV